MKRSFRNKFAVGCGVAACAIYASPAIGQTADASEEEEVFTLSPFEVDASQDQGYRATNTISGTRLNTAIKDIPMPIEVITEQFIKDTGSTDLRESLGYSAGIILKSQNDAGAGNSFSSIGGVHNPEGATANKTQTTYKVRGFITDATLRDGYRRQNASDSANIGRVEVIRGPAALLYGIGNFGGIVNYLPIEPPAEQRQNATITVGNHQHRRATYMIGGPLGTKWNLRYNLVATYEENGSYTELKEDDHYFVAPIFKFNPGENTEVTVDLEYGSENGKAIGFQSVRSRTGVTGQQDRLERSGFLEFPGKNIRTMRWSGPDTFVNTDSSNARIQMTHRFTDNFNVLLGFNKSKVEFSSRDLSGGIDTSIGPESLRGTIYVTPADVVNGDGEFEAGPVEDAIFNGWWTDANETVNREQVRVEASYKFDLFPNSELFKIQNSFLLGHSEEKSEKDVFTRGTLENQRTYWNPTDPSYIRFGVNGDGSAAPAMENIVHKVDKSWNQGTYLVHQGKFLKDRVTTVMGVRRDRNDLLGYTRDFRLDTESTADQDAKSKNTSQIGLSVNVTDSISLYALRADGIMPNFDGNRDVWGNPMDAVTAQSKEVGVKFDLMDGKLSGTVSAYRIKQTGTPIFYWWAPAPAKGTFDPNADIIYNVADFNPTVEADWRNQAFTASLAQWNAAVNAGSAYQLDGTWYVNASMPTGAAYLDAAFDNTKALGGWPGWLYNQDANTNNATMDWASAATGGWNAYLSGDQESQGWEAQINFAPTDSLQFVLNYAHTTREVVNAGAFPTYPYADGNWDRWAVWYFPDGQWGLTGAKIEDQFTDPQDTGTWQGIGYGAGETQDDTPKHAVSGWGNYVFKEGALEGLSLGLGFQWESKREYFSGITDGAGQLVKDSEGKRVILYTKDRLNVDAMARYAFQIKDRDAHVQVNVYNVAADKKAYGFLYAQPLSYRVQFGLDF